MRRPIPLLLLVLLAPSPGCDTDTGANTAEVIAISDGDTLTVLKPDRTQVKIRLFGIDAPEGGQEFGSRAKEAASSLAFGKTVTVHARDTDRYGRTVAEVTLPDGRSLNHEPVSQGMAWWFRRYAPGDRELQRLEAAARTARRGLWAHPKPIPPWDWRTGVGVPQTAGVIGNRRTRLYHAPHCRGVAVMKDTNRVGIWQRFATKWAIGPRQASDTAVKMGIP